MKLVNGVDVDSLGDMQEEYSYPKEVPGRTVHIDGDFVAYEASYKEDLSLETQKKNCSLRLEHIRKASGAANMRVHLTAAGGTKGGRYDQAMLKQYQATRKKDKPTNLERIRLFMRDDFGALYWKDREADDGMAQANYNAIKYGNPGMSVIASRDKDLQMVPGLHFNFETGEVEEYTALGYISLLQKKSGKKLVGTGWSFFLAQLLMGDQADNISGLPAIYGMPGFRDGSKCGPVAAYTILSNVVCENKLDQLQKSICTIMGLYKAYGDAVGFCNWRDKTPIKWNEALISEMSLLWMRRSSNPNDVTVWLKEVFSATSAKAE